MNRTEFIFSTAIILFVAAYSLVITEEFTHLRKSKPVMLAAGVIWGLIAYQYAGSDEPYAAADAVLSTALDDSADFRWGY